MITPMRTVTMLALLAAPATATPPPPVLSAGAAVLIEPDTGQVLYEDHADQRMYPASLTKMMTALLVAESGDLDRYVTVSPRAAAVGETTMNLKAGERVKLEHLLLGVMLNSANDAAAACAEAVDGTVSAFVDHMNRRAQELGLRGTHFTNATGLHHDNHYSTARDLALLAVQVMARPELRGMARMRQARVPGPEPGQQRLLVNRNRLLGQWEACDGIKTGYTRQAGRCLAASAFVDDWRLIAVVLNCKDAWSDARTLLEWGFAHYYKVALVAKDITRAKLRVRGGQSATVECTAAEDVLAVLERGQLPAQPRLDTDTVRAPIAVGDVVAHISVVTPVGQTRTVDMRATADVAPTLWAMLWTNRYLTVAGLVLVCAAVGVLIYAAAAEAAGARRIRQSPQM